MVYRLDLPTLDDFAIERGVGVRIAHVVVESSIEQSFE